jgi:hypothetical protein
MPAPNVIKATTPMATSLLEDAMNDYDIALLAIFRCGGIRFY